MTVRDWTNVFMKGCPLKCAWCHDAQNLLQQSPDYWKRRLCAQCGACLRCPPKDAIMAPIAPERSGSEGSTYHKINRTRCDGCMKCVDVCRYEALG